MGSFNVLDWGIDKFQTIKSELKHYGLPVKVYRVGDKQNDKLPIPKD